MVSVIIPTFNRAGKTLRAVRSVLKQTYRNLEVVVVDDGSTDGTRDLIVALDDERVRYLWQENAGAAAARNVGLAHAKGDFIALLDSDDTWLPWKLEAQLAVLAAFPEAGMVWTDMAGVDPSGKLLHPRLLAMRYSAYRYLDLRRDCARLERLEDIWPALPAPLTGSTCCTGDVYAQMFLGNLALESTFLIRRERQEATGTFDLRFSGGYDFFLRASEIGQVAFLDAVTVNYQMGADDQLSGRHGRVRAANDNLAVIEKALATSPRAQTLPKPIKRERMARCHHWIGIEEFFHDRRSARRHFAVVLKSRPLQDVAMQRRALLFWFVSFLPTPVTLGLRRAKRSFAGARGVATAPDRRPASP